MAMPRKKSRTLIVDGATYRWTLTGNRGSLFVVVESEESPGQVLQAEFDAEDSFESIDYRHSIHTQGKSITPKTISRVVRYALAKGWNPNGKNLRPFVLNTSETSAAEGASEGNE